MKQLQLNLLLRYGIVTIGDITCKKPLLYKINKGIRELWAYFTIKNKGIRQICGNKSRICL
jgi:hypothetical protein